MDTLDLEDVTLRICYYGDPGVGKTTAAAAMADLGRIVYIDTEQGLKAKALERVGIPISNIEPHREITYPALVRLVDQLEERCRTKEAPVGLVWDSMTATVGTLLAEITTAAAERARKAGRVRATYTAQQDDWGDAIAQIRELMRRVRALPIHLVFTAHAKRGNDEDGKVRVGPSVSPALQQDLMAYTDAVVMIRQEQLGGSSYRVGTCQPEGKFDAKDRIGLFPPKLAEPTFPRLLAYVEGDLDRDTDPLQLEVREAAAQISPNRGEDNAQAD